MKNIIKNTISTILATALLAGAAYAGTNEMNIEELSIGEISNTYIVIEVCDPFTSQDVFNKLSDGGIKKVRHINTTASADGKCRTEEYIIER